MTPPQKPRREIGFHAIPRDAANPGKVKAKRKMTPANLLLEASIQ